MSHIVSIRTEVRDATAVIAACRRLGLAPPVHKTAQLFTSTATGFVVQLPRWRYPVVCDLSSGSLQFDNFNGQWGDQKELYRFLQSYAVEKASLEARRRGHSVSEQTLSDGSVKLTIQVNGGAA